MLGREFRKLWVGQSISFVGSQITSVALPLTAVLVLDAGAAEMGWLVAAEHLPMALFGLTRDAVLRPLALCGGLHNICSTMIVAIYILHVTRNLGIGPLLLGFIFACGGVGALVGSIVSARVARRLGVGPSLIVAQALTGVPRLCIPLAVGPLLLVASELLLGMVRALSWVLTPLGALAGGYLSAWLGMRTTLWIAAGGVALATLPALNSALRVTREAGQP